MMALIFLVTLSHAEVKASPCGDQLRGAALAVSSPALDHCLGYAWSPRDALYRGFRSVASSVESLAPDDVGALAEQERRLAVIRQTFEQTYVGQCSRKAKAQLDRAKLTCDRFFARIRKASR